MKYLSFLEYIIDASISFKNKKLFGEFIECNNVVLVDSVYGLSIE